MQNIIRLFARYGTQITFILLQIVCFTIIVKYNNTQKAIFLNSSNLYAAKLDSKLGKWQTYLSLEEVNDSLAEHNANLLELYINRKEIDPVLADSSLLQYQLIPANITNNTYQLRNNHITVDKGSAAGVTRDMGVISQNGIVGIVRNISSNFAHVVSILNVQTRISATVKPYAYPGTVVWKGTDPSTVILEAIPKHADIQVGDTVVTSGYSTIFPADIAIGEVSSFNIDRGSSNYEIKVRLYNDVPNEKQVYIVNNTLAAEQKQLEAEINE